MLAAVSILTFTFQVKTYASLRSEKIKEAVEYLSACGNFIRYDAENVLSRPYEDEEHPRAFAQYKNKLVIAHGRLGISFFDLTTKKVTRAFPVALSHRPLESVVNGVTVSGRYAFAALDSYNLVGDRDKPAFRGIVVIDLETESVISELDGMDPGADSLTSDNNVAIVSFYGQPLSKYSVAGLSKASTLPAPLKRFWKFPIDRKQTGKASMDDKYYYRCFSRMPKLGEGPYFIKVPMVFDRRVLMLD